MKPEIFGWQHLVFLAIIIVLGIASVVLIKLFCKSERAVSIAIKVYSAFLLIWIVANRICVAVNNHNALSFIPNTFCGIASLSIAIIGLVAKKDAGIWHWAIYCGLLGGFLTMLYPDFIGQAQSIFYPATITGLMHHSVMFFLCVTVLATGYMRPSIKKWAWLPLGLCVMMTFGIFLITALKFGGAMYINEPLIEGTVFTWYFTGFIFLALHLATLLIIEYVRLRKSGRRLFEKKNKEESK